MIDKLLRVLIVDDVKSEACAIGMVLQKKLKAEFDVATNEKEARLRLNSTRYDLVTLDYQLENYSGLKLLSEILDSEDPPPVLFITGHSREGIAVEAFKLGALGHINKEADLYDRLVEEARYVLSKAASIKAEMATEKEILEQSLLLHNASGRSESRI